jgi:hypothetical protein
MAFLVGLVAEMGTAVFAESLGVIAEEGMTQVAQNEMTQVPEGMVEESQEVINETQMKSVSSPKQEEKKEAETSLNVENELKKNFIQQQSQEAEKRRKEVENQLNL